MLLLKPLGCLGAGPAEPQNHCLQLAKLQLLPVPGAARRGPQNPCLHQERFLHSPDGHSCCGDAVLLLDSLTQPLSVWWGDWGRVWVVCSFFFPPPFNAFENPRMEYNPYATGQVKTQVCSWLYTNRSINGPQNHSGWKRPLRS